MKSTHLIVTLCTVFITWSVLAIFLVDIFSVSSDESGKMGDTFGIINSLFSSLAFAGIVYSILQQQREIEQTNKQFNLQRFEASFFSWIQLQNETVKSMDLRNSKQLVTAEGRDCFRSFHSKFKDGLKKFRQSAKRGTNVQDVINIYDGEIFNQHKGDLAHYFINLYHIVKFIDEENGIENKKRYLRIVRSQLSTFELIMLFYNGLSHHGKNFKPLINKLGLLHNMDWELLMDKKHLFEYELSAYDLTEWPTDILRLRKVE